VSGRPSSNRIPGQTLQNWRDLGIIPVEADPHHLSVSTNDMFTLEGYEILDPIHESSRSTVCRARRLVDGLGVVLKALARERPLPEEVARRRHEYAILKSLDLAGVVTAHSLEEHSGGPVLVLEDFGAERLSEWVGRRRPDLPGLISLAVRIVSILGEIHAAQIIHKDVNPTNLICSVNDGRIKLIDFDIAGVFSREDAFSRDPVRFQGTLPYISPEQTGRTNRLVDYRTDYYSLGVTLYELLCGCLPFESNNPLELVHCHIARVPVPPADLIPALPRPLSDIVMKLMAKDASERYQSARGIRADLEECARRLQGPGPMKRFPLARQDAPARFIAPQKLYGRQVEVDTLLKAFERVSAGSKELILVSGPPGSGKTSLVREIYEPVTRRKGCFVYGKCDQFQGDVFDSAMVEAFRLQVRGVLTGSDERLAEWREKLTEALGPNGAVLAQMIPELEFILGPQPPAAEVAPVEARNRFNLLFKAFLKLWCDKDHPTVLFLDDLQWVDATSLRLLELILDAEDVRFLLVIGSYRPDEVSPAHGLMRAIDRRVREGATVHSVSLDPLEIEQVSELVSDAVRCDKDSAGPLAEVVLQKTGGNPFFAHEFMKSLYEEKLLDFDQERGVWAWDLRDVEKQSITQNIADLMSERIKNLDLRTQEALRLASCLGSRFELGILAPVLGYSPLEAMGALREAVSQGMLIGLVNVWTSGDLNSRGLDANLPVELKFAHDRIRQAAYELIPESGRPAIHLRLGRKLIEQGFASSAGEKLFQVVDHLNAAVGLAGEEDEIVRLAELNLMAAKKAKAAASYEAAFRYAKSGVGLLKPEGWETHHHLTLELHLAAAEGAYLCADIEESERLSKIVLRHAGASLEKVRAYEVRIQACVARYDMLEAVRTALDALGLLGIRLPLRPSKSTLVWAIVRTKFLLFGKNIESLLDLPEMTDPNARAALRIMSSAAKAVYAVVPELVPLFVCQTVNLSLKYGNAPDSAIAYATYAMVLAGILGETDRGYRFGELALNLAQRFGSSPSSVRSVMSVYFFVKPCKEHYRESIEHFADLYKRALELGALEDAALCAYFYCTSLFRTGAGLQIIELEMGRHCEAIRKMRQETAHRLISIFRQAVLNLMGHTADPCVLVGSAYDEKSEMPQLRRANDRSAVCVTYLNKLHLCVLFHDYVRALENSEGAEKYLDGVRATAGEPTFYFYDSLARLALYQSGNRTDRRALLKKAASNQKRIKKWARHAPMNHLHKALLIDAERFRALGKDGRAERCYEQAIEAASRNQYIHEEALATELAGRFHLSRGRVQSARDYIRRARSLYSAWGARAKVRHLDDKYYRLMEKPSESLSTVSDERTLTSTISNENELNLDLNAVLETSLAISGEIVLEKLLDKLMRIVIESAGAQKGILIIDSEDGLTVRSEVKAEEDSRPVLQANPLELCQGLSQGVVRYVARTEEIVVLGDAAEEGIFTADPYVSASRPKSILCAPLLHRGRLVGVVYLENNLATNSFTPSRVELLRIICSQAAISLENALLYERMEQLVLQRTHELQWSNKELHKEILVKERTQQALIHAKLEAEAANRAKSEFLANMSHELRTPLNAVIGFSEILLDLWPGPLNEKQTQYLNQVWESGRHLLQLINEILDLAKVESGKMELRVAPVNVWDLLHGSVGMIRETAVRKGLNLEVRIPDETRSAMVEADEVKLKQIMLNLLSNAAKFTPAGGTVTVEASMEDNALRVTVSDTGIGIDPEYAERIFGAFEQVDSSLSRRQEGTGLGLALSRRLAEFHHGRLWVESEGEGMGSAFTLKIPVSPTSSVIDSLPGQAEGAVAEPLAPEAVRQAQAGPRPKVLVIEDSDASLKLAESLVEAAGYTPLKARTADEGVRMAEAEAPALILMDISLPGMDGLTATRMLKQSPKTSHIPVVALTAHAMKGDREKALEAGFDAYLTKPVDRQSFMATLRRLI
jgi:predicted ATPase/signal transduction histidine kinase/CheY-like chemotaxis protein/tRNA A-37 threonylcarbamoyl transferase component Bud32